MGQTTVYLSHRWTDKEGVIAQTGPCNIDVRDATLTQQEFTDK